MQSKESIYPGSLYSNSSATFTNKKTAEEVIRRLNETKASEIWNFRPSQLDSKANEWGIRYDLKNTPVGAFTYSGLMTIKNVESYLQDKDSEGLPCYKVYNDTIDE